MTQTPDWEKVAPTTREVFCGMAAILAWMTLFITGLIIPTMALRNSIVATTETLGQARSNASATASSPAAVAAAAPTADAGTGAAKPPVFRTDLRPLEYIGFTLLVGVAFTLTNLWFLCLTSAFLGCMGRRWSTTFDPEEPNRQKDQVTPEIKEVRRAYTTAVLRGFLVYLMVLAGYLLLVPENTINQITMGQYARLAGAVSALSFVVGWRPESINSLLASAFAPIGAAATAKATKEQQVVRTLAVAQIESTAESSETIPVTADKPRAQPTPEVGLPPTVGERLLEYLKEDQSKLNGEPVPLDDFWSGHRSSGDLPDLAEERSKLVKELEDAKKVQVTIDSTGREFVAVL